MTRIRSIFVGLILALVLIASEKVNAVSMSEDGPTVYLEWVDDPLRSMVVNWIVGQNEFSPVLEYRLAGSSSWEEASGTTHSIPHSSMQRNSVNVTGLSPGESYEFRVEGSGSIFRFRTAAESIESPLRFIVGGDIYAESETQQQRTTMEEIFIDMSTLAASHDPHFAVLGGDLAHASSREIWVDLMLDMLKAWQAHMVTPDGYLIPVVAVIGNNDVEGSYGGGAEEAAAFHALFSFPQGQWSDIRGYGVLDFNDYLSILVLDTDHSTEIEGVQTDWLESRIKERGAFHHRFPVYHVAGWPAFRSFRGTQQDRIRNNWHPIFRANDIRFVFEHHDHIYKRTYPIGDCQVPINHSLSCDISADGVLYTGGGPWSSAVRDLNEEKKPDGSWYHDELHQVHNFMLIEITDTYRTAKAFDRNGNIFDEFTDVIYLDPPVVLHAENLTETGFTARWESVEDVTRYRLDLSTNPNFTSFVSGYRSQNVGNTTLHEIEGLDPERSYFYRVRAENPATVSDNSQVMSVPRPPAVQTPDHVGAGMFTAKWEPVPDATGYRLDVATDPGFNNFVAGYNDFNIGVQSEAEIEGLQPSTTYYYRVRTESTGGGISRNSGHIEVTTESIDIEHSTVSVSLFQILANGEQETKIHARVVNEEGEPLDNIFVDLRKGENEPETLVERRQTGPDGETEFTISGSEPGTITYWVVASGIQVGGPFRITFLPMDGRVKLGDNFPNPFSGETLIPVTIPEPMHVKLDVLDIAGNVVKKLADRQFSEGHHEILFRTDDLASGVYIYRIITSQIVLTEKMLLVK